MARNTEEPNRSEAIRSLLQKHPEMVTKEVIETLGQQGLEVKPGLVYLIRGKMKEGANVPQTNGGRHSNGGRRSKTPSDGAVAMIRQVKALAAEAGGLDKLKDLVDVLAE